MKQIPFLMMLTLPDGSPRLVNLSNVYYIDKPDNQTSGSRLVFHRTAFDVRETQTEIADNVHRAYESLVEFGR